MPKKFKLQATLAVLLMGLIACQPSANNSANSTDTELPGKDRSVRPAQSTLLEENFQVEIVNIGMEKLCYQVEPAKEMEYANMHVAIANRDLDYAATHYEKLHAQFFESVGGEDKIQRLGTIVPNIFQEYQIDKKQQIGIT